MTSARVSALIDALSSAAGAISMCEVRDLENLLTRSAEAMQAYRNSGSLSDPQASAASDMADHLQALALNVGAAPVGAVAAVMRDVVDLLQRLQQLTGCELEDAEPGSRR